MPRRVPVIAVCALAVSLQAGCARRKRPVREDGPQEPSRAPAGQSAVQEAATVQTTMQAGPQLDSEEALAEVEIRKDRFGDPLPKGAIARLGTVRLRHPAPIFTCAFSHDNRFLASGDMEGNVRIWSMRDGERLHALKAHDGAVSCVSFSPDDQRLVTVSHAWLDDMMLRENRFKLWDIAAGKVMLDLDTEPHGNDDSFSFTPDGSRLLVGGAKGRVVIYDAADARPVGELVGHSGVIGAVAVSPDGERVATMDEKRVLRLWSLSERRELRSWDIGQQLASRIASTEGHSARPEPPVRHVAFGCGGQVLVSWDWRHALVRSLERDQELHFQSIADDRVNVIHYVPGQDVLMTKVGAPPGQLAVYRRVSSTGVEVITEDAEIRSLEPYAAARWPPWPVQAFSHDGKLTAEVSPSQNAIRVPLEREGKTVAERAPMSPDYGWLSVSSDGRLVAKGGYRVWVWEAASGKVVCSIPLKRRARGELNPTVSLVRFSRDDRFVVGGRGSAHVAWDVETAERAAVVEFSEREELLAGPRVHVDAARAAIREYLEGVPPPLPDGIATGRDADVSWSADRSTFVIVRQTGITVHRSRDGAVLMQTQGGQTGMALR